MKKHLTSIAVVFAVLAMAWSAFAPAEEASPNRSGRRDEQTARPRARTTRPTAAGTESGPPRGMAGLSAEERAKMRERFMNMSAEERDKFRAEMRERFDSRRGPGGPGGMQGRPNMMRGPGGPGGDMARTYARQIEELKAQHEKTVAELRTILELARKENAAQTIKGLEGLIAKRQKAFQGSLQSLEQRRQRFERMRPRPDGSREIRRPGAKKAPDFTLKSFAGKETALAALRGKIVVLEWINFGCPFSLYHYETKQTMVDTAKKYKDKNVVWLAINSTSQSKVEANQAFAKKHKLPYPILNDTPGLVGKMYKAKTTPHVFVIDAGGAIVYNGAIDNAPNGKLKKGQEYVNYVAGALDAVIAGKRVTTPQTKPYGCTVKYPQK